MTVDLTVEQAADHFQVRAPTLRRWLRAGVFPHAYRLSNKAGWRIPVRDINALKRTTRQSRNHEEAS
jgi:predicted site-specific integrase-resolvase